VNSTTTDIAEHEEKAVCPSPPDAVRHIPAMPSNALAELAAKMKSLASPRLASPRHGILKSMPEGKHSHSTSPAKSPGPYPPVKEWVVRMSKFQDRPVLG
jgi:hypothetical protein